MRTILLLLLVAFLQKAAATNYYFSSISGDDSRSATQASSSSAPWKTLGKLNSFFSALQPGDSVLLKRDETFYGSIIVNKSGTSTAPIIIGAYGSGNKPAITSLVSVTGWVSKGNGIFESANALSGTAAKVVLLNGVQQELGRYPNSDAPNKGYLYFESHSGTTSITDQQLTSSPNWTGADVVIRPRRWVLDRNLITSQSGTTINYTGSCGYAPTDKYGYFIENSIKTLDKFGEWYYNPSTKKLSVYFGSNNPSSYTLQSATTDDMIHDEKFNYVTFDNLNIIGANACGVNIRYGSNVYVTNCDINFSGENGVKSIYHTYLKVEGCTINNSNFGGINMGYSGDNAIIRNNKILNTSIFPGMTQDGDQAGLGIMSYGNNNIIEYNEIRKVGFNGITFNGNYVTIKNNFIDSFCFVKDDGGGIYTINSNATAQVGRKITGNIITNGVGAPDGAYNPWAVPAQGIYLDNGSSNIEVTGNTVANLTDQGIFIHNSNHIKISGNVVFNITTRCLAMIENASHPQIRNCTVNGNIFFKTLAPQTFLYINSDGTDENQFAVFSGNYYASPADNNTATVLSGIKVYESAAAIKSFTTPFRFECNSTQAGKTIALDASYTDAKNLNFSGNITLQPYTSVVLIKSSGSINTAPTVSITSPAANAGYNAPAAINISAAASDADGSIAKVEFYNGSTLLHTVTTAPYTYSWQNVPAGNYTLTAKATDNSGNVTTSSNVSVSVSGASSSSSPTVRITSPVVNAGYIAPATINMSTDASDADGSIAKVEFYNGSVLLHTEIAAPYTYSWQNVPAGNYTLTAKATDNSGNVTTSSAVSISVTSSSYPFVSITSPTQNQSFALSSTVNMSANASDPDGSIKKVEFYKGSTLLHTETVAPYTYSWTNVPAGNYTHTAKATDNSGKVTTSSPVAISVVSSGTSSKSIITNASSTNVNINNVDTADFNKLIVNKTSEIAYYFSLFPNPSVNKIQINFNNAPGNSKANLFIINVQGNVLKSIPVILSGKIMDVDISALRTGIYIMRLAGDGFVVSRKFVKIN